MNGIKAIYNFTNNQWSIETTNLRPDNNSIEFVFISEEEYSDLSNYQFGFILESNNEFIKSSKFPAEGVKLLQVSRNPFYVDQVSLTIDQEYKFRVYIMGPGETSESQITFTGPKPPQPFPSWTWADNQWNAPKIKPPGPYFWDEEKQNWIQAEKNFPYPSN